MRATMVTTLFLLGVAGAQDVDCPTLRADGNWNLSYASVEKFPDPVKKTRLDLYALTKPLTLKACGVTVKADARSYSIDAETIQALQQVMGGLWSFDVYGVQMRSGQPAYFRSTGLSIDLPDGLMNTDVRVTGTFAGNYLPKDALMAVRVNGGKLMPLLYDGSFRKVSLDPKLDTLEVLIRSSKPVLWERLLLDSRTRTMTFFKRYPFPAR